MWRRYEVQRAERVAMGAVTPAKKGWRGAVDGFMGRGTRVKGWGGSGGSGGVGEGGMRNGGV